MLPVMCGSCFLLREATQSIAGLEILYATVQNRLPVCHITVSCTGIASHRLGSLLFFPSVAVISNFPTVTIPPLNDPQWVQPRSWILLITDFSKYISLALFSRYAGALLNISSNRGKILDIKRVEKFMQCNSVNVTFSVSVKIMAYRVRKLY